MDAEAERANVAAARADAAERRAAEAEKCAAEAEAKLSRKHEADVQAAVLYMLAPGELMKGAAKVRAAEWAAALEMSDSLDK